MIKNKHSLLLLLLYLLLTASIGSYLHFFEGHPARLDPSILLLANGAKDINPRRDECHRPKIDDLKKTGGCKVNPSSIKPPSFYSFGDSFSATLLPTLDKLAQEYGISGLQSSYSSCPPIFGVERREKIDNPSEYSCYLFNQTVKGIIDSRNIKNILVFARWSAYFNEYKVSSPDNQKVNSEDFFANKFIETLQYFKKNDIEVWIVQQPPEYEVNIPHILARRAIKGMPPETMMQDLEIYQMRQKKVNALFSKIQQNEGFKNVHFIDPAATMCPEQNKCMTSANGRPLYRDTNHLSQYGVHYLEPLLKPFFKNIQESHNVTAR